METRSIDLGWIVVSDIDSALKYYSEVIGLQVESFHKDFGWAELKGTGGARLGLTQANPEFDAKAGVNAVMTITVDNIVATKAALTNKGVTFIGDILEVPGHVKLQTFADADGNQFQLVEKLD